MLKKHQQHYEHTIGENEGQRESWTALCWNILVLQLHDRLYSPVVVVEVDGANHFGTFEVTDLHCDFADGVAANEFDNLLCGGVAGIHFDGWQFYVLEDKKDNKQYYTAFTSAGSYKCPLASVLVTCF